MNTFNAGNEYFSAGDERIENVRSNFSHTHAVVSPTVNQVNFICNVTSCFQHNGCECGEDGAEKRIGTQTTLVEEGK